MINGIFNRHLIDIHSMEYSQTKLFGENQYITGTHAMSILGLSRHTFEKMVQKGLIARSDINGHIAYDKGVVEAFKQHPEYIRIQNGVLDERNQLNDLTGKDWLPETKSYFYQKGLGANHPDAQIEKQHPAPFSFQDIERLILFFTKKGMNVLDPFGGVGSTAKACAVSGRHCTSIELSPKYHNLSIERLEKEVGRGTSTHHNLINGDSCQLLPTYKAGTFDFIVTSPPYWGILHKQDQKVVKNRVANNLDTHYSDDDKDLGNISDYEKFLDILIEKVFMECARVLKHNKYMAIVVSDFRDKGEYVSFHSDIICRMKNRPVKEGGCMVLQGTKILIQNHKSLLPYGYPFSYVENIHHQYVLIFRKK